MTGVGTRRCDALIVGAGPAGSATAILLAAAGWSVALVEKQRFPRRKVCGECIAASNLPLLHALGIGAAFDAAAGPALQRVALMRGARTVLADLPAAAGDAPWGRALGRETLDTLLVAQARAVGVELLQPWAVDGLDGGPGAWTCRARDLQGGAERTLEAAVAIAAHGSWEPMPAARPARRATRSPSDLFAFKANFSKAALPDGLLGVLSFDGGYGGMVVADGDIATLAGCVRRDRLDAARQASGLRAGAAFEALLMAGCGGVADALGAARREGAWLAAGPIAPGCRLRAGDGIFRVGNAAGEAHPIIGEGMSMALQGAWLLAAHLLDGPPSGSPDASAGAGWQAPVAAAYARAWRQQFSGRLRLAAAFAHAAMRPAGALPLGALASRWPGLVTRGAAWSGKVRSVAGPAALAAAAGRVAAAARPVGRAA
jgi:menaquinone-9 beta-reductase